MKGAKWEPDEASELDEELELAAEEFLDFLLDPVSSGEKREDEVTAVGGDEVSERGGEHVWAVSDSAAAPVNELQFLTGGARDPSSLTKP